MFKFLLYYVSRKILHSNNGIIAQLDLTQNIVLKPIDLEAARQLENSIRNSMQTEDSMEKEAQRMFH